MKAGFAASVFLMIIALSCFAQEQVLFGRDTEYGGYGAPELKYTDLNDEMMVCFGERSGWIIDHKFVVGGAFYTI